MHDSCKCVHLGDHRQDRKKMNANKVSERPMVNALAKVFFFRVDDSYTKFSIRFTKLSIPYTKLGSLY